MAKVNYIWAIAVAEISINGDMFVTTTSAAKELKNASELFDKLIWTYIKEYGFTVEDEENTFAKSTVYMRNGRGKQAILTCTKTPLQ